MIVETLQRHDGKLQETASEMGIHRATLWRKMKKMKIPQQFSGTPMPSLPRPLPADPKSHKD
jgi:DNA-binding NtrC family response regulator